MTVPQKRAGRFALSSLFVAAISFAAHASNFSAASSSALPAPQANPSALAPIVQQCIGYSSDRPWPKHPGPNPDTIQFCRQLPAWSSYEQAQQKFMGQDHAGAARILLSAANSGNPLAALRLAIMYDNGDGIAVNKREAFRWFLFAAQAGEPAAQKEVGSFYEDGAIIPQDWMQAAKWYQLSAQSGWNQGQQSFGRCYQYGIGVPLNLGQALTWYSRAADNGNKQAEFFANYIRDNHGFDGSYMSDDEKNIYDTMIGGLPMLSYMVPPPGGRTFRNKAERFAYIRNGIARILWNEYDNCLHAPRPYSNTAPPRTCMQPSVPRPQ